ncbi:MAG: FG-GAP-like repeat-containing protein, partial [Opitutae bacterium]
NLTIGTLNSNGVLGNLTVVSGTANLTGGSANVTTVSGGTLLSAATLASLAVNSGTANISGGSVTGATTSAATLNLTGGNLTSLAITNGISNLTGGNVTGTVTLTNGTLLTSSTANLSGTINVCVADMNGDRIPDIVAVVSQQWEEIHIFENNGHGVFTDRKLFGSTNEDFGSSGISLCDLNRDGLPDIIYSNGDGFAYADPGGRPWHGLQWLENLGQGYFRYHRIGDLTGAYSPVGIDVDGDGAIDVVAISSFNDWKNPQSPSLVYFKNDGKMNFTLKILAHVPYQLMSCATGDLDGSGRPAIISGGFYSYPPFEHMSRLTLWRQHPPP